MAIVNIHYGFCAKGGAAVKFTYTGEYNVRDDGVVELLTSGTIVFLEPAVIDVFCVGGGGAGSTPYASGSYGSGGGGGGYTAIARKLNVSGSLEVTIGEGGKRSANDTYTPAGATSFGNLCTANGGKNGFVQNPIYGYDQLDCYGAAGGSGGGGGVSSNSDYGTGGSDGQNGEDGYSSSSRVNVQGGAGQGSSTREFGEATGKLYAGGGGGGRFMSSATPVVSMGGAGGGGSGGWYSTVAYQAAAGGVANTGGGGGGGAQYSSSSYRVKGASGGSGIVCFRAAK